MSRPRLTPRHSAQVPSESWRILLYSEFVKSMTISGEHELVDLQKIHHFHPIPATFPNLDHLSLKIFRDISDVTFDPSIFPPTLKGFEITVTGVSPLRALLSSLHSHFTSLRSHTLVSIYPITEDAADAPVQFIQANRGLTEIILCTYRGPPEDAPMKRILQTISRLEHLRRMSVYFPDMDSGHLSLEPGYPSLASLRAGCPLDRINEILLCIRSPVLKKLRLEIRGFDMARLSSYLAVERFSASLKKVSCSTASSWI